MSNFLVVLFKDRKRKKIINKFVNIDRALSFFEKYKRDSDSIVFHKEIVNGDESEYELGLVQVGKNADTFVYLKDDLGRNVRVNLSNENMSLLKIYPLKVEELLYDYQTKKKITFDDFIKRYLRGTGVKMISGLNNKVILQEEDLTKIFVLKNQKDCERFLDCLSNHFFRTKRVDCLVVKDSSVAQRKYLYSLLESKGFDKTFLYRKSTFQSQ